MSLTYVITTLFRGDDIEQTEYVIGQLEGLSAKSHQILVFNGGLYPRGQKWLEKKYSTVKVIELDAPDDWGIQSEFHYCRFVWTQLHKYVDTDFYLKMDRDVCVINRDFDSILVDFMTRKPNIAAAGIHVSITSNDKLRLDDFNLFQDLPRSVSYHNTKLLNGGVEIFRTSSMNEVGAIVEDYGKWIWRDITLNVGEDDLISFVLQGTGHILEDCPYLGYVPAEMFELPLQDDIDSIADILYTYLHTKQAEFCLLHGFKPFSKYRKFYGIMHELLGRENVIEIRNKPNEADRYCLNPVLLPGSLKRG